MREGVKEMKRGSVKGKIHMVFGKSGADTHAHSKEREWVEFFFTYTHKKQSNIHTSTLVFHAIAERGKDLWLRQWRICSC